MSLAKKVAIVTGASSGIGAATAVKFTEEGATVVIVGRNANKLKNVSDICTKRGAKPLTIIADVSNDADAKRIITETLRTFNKLDILVNNAGIGGFANILDDKAIETFDKIIAINLRAPVYLTHLAAKHLIETKGNIINISSVAGMMASAGASAYCTSKAGLDHFSKCVALELAAHGVRVNNVNPGPVKTDFIDNIDSMPKEGHDGFWDSVTNMTALKRVSDSEEIADLVVFLAGNRSRGVTGSLVVSDNGLLLRPSPTNIHE